MKTEPLPSSPQILTNSISAIQYVRCTLQKSPDDVSPCVSKNAVKVDWLPQIQTYTGAQTCPNVNSYLATQGIHILRHIIGALLPIFIWPTFLHKARQRFTFIRRLLPNTARYIPNFNPWVREKRYNLKATRLLQSIGREVLVAFLTVLVLEKSGHFATSSFNTEISFYVIRPRPAPFIGFLGIFEPWSQQGLAELVVDGMLSFVAGTNVALKYFSLVNNPPDNPAAPVAGLKNLAVGAIMTCIPAFAVLAITLLVSMAMASDNKGKKRRKNDDGCSNLIGGLCIWTFTLMVIAIFICLLPLIALIEMISSVINTIQRKRGKNKKGQRAPVDYDNDLGLWSNIVRRSPWEEPLTTTSGKFRFLYAIFVLSSFIINIGNWLFFASYLTLEGEMYCPVKFKKIMAMWILIPLGIDLVFYAFRVWTNDTYFDTHGHEALGL
ncbi:MAG: hypothetical protein M1839_009611 [Geoglossum umbratile]|nr:MAG: hypothetical protein M1839_009611 [Geoglossum umbratile]